MRLRVPIFLGLINALALGYIWFLSDAMQQIRVLQSIITLALTFLLLFLWFVIGSGAPKKARLGVALGTVGMALLLGATFRYRGVSGDMLPILEFRFAAARALPEPPAHPPPPSDAPAVVPSIEPGEAVAAGSPTAPETTTAAPVAAPPEALPTPAMAQSHQDWPQYHGPNRNGVLTDAGLARDWSAAPPRLLWRQPVGTGWSGFAVAGDTAITQEQRGDEERVIAYGLKTGRPLWSHADKARHDSPLGSEGPRAVPTIDGGQVFALGATGILNALDLATGRLLWSRNILQDNGSIEPEWGVAVSPLVRGGRVIVSAGGSGGRALVAYDRQSGEPSWAGGSGGLAYSSPVLMRLGDRDQVVMLNKGTVAGHDAETGATLWEQAFPNEQPNVAQPIPLSESRVLFSVGYGIGSKVFEISAGAGPGPEMSARMVWSTPRLKSKFANMILFEGSVYGLDDGVMVCLDPETGERRWKAGRFGHGQLILAGRTLLLQAENGEIIMIDPSPKGLVELTRFRALDSKTWNPPALASPILLVRNDLEAAAYELPVIRR